MLEEYWMLLRLFYKLLNKCLQIVLLHFTNSSQLSSHCSEDVYVCFVRIMLLLELIFRNMDGFGKLV